jgi:uncharacterized protein YkwD
MRSITGFRQVVAVALVATLWFGFAGRVSAAPTEDERAAEVKLLKIINRARQAQGLKLLKEHNVITDEARAQSERMAEQGVLNHAGLEARKTRIANADSGISEDQICEAVASPPFGNVRRQMKKTFAAWRADEVLGDCLLDGLGYTSRSAGIGVVIADNMFWVTFIGAADETTGSR